MLRDQERIVADKGYEMIRVKTMNRFPAMLKLLLSHGYLIIGYGASSSPMEAKASFSKNLA
ncbi:MAG: hypothetical protein CMM23_15840 [Rhodospirillaceae bacterium]|nr:hypothetical protein [Rhodospirillaceae bacterium]